MRHEAHGKLGKLERLGELKKPSDYRPRRPIVVAAGQMAARLMNESAATLDAIDWLIAEAQRQGAELLVLPECAYPAYLLGSVETYRTGDHLSSEQFVERLSRRARESGLYIVCGYVEDTGKALYNSAILLGPDGERSSGGQQLGNRCKSFLWGVDREWFTPGDNIKAFDTPLGRIGIAICAEVRVPEVIATLATDGAELIVVPTCWVNLSRQPGEFRNPQPEFLIAARAREFGVPFVCADKTGIEMTMGYVGKSCIVDADGFKLVQAPTRGDALIVSTVTPTQAKRAIANDAQRARLLDERPPISPTRTQPTPIVLTAIPKELTDQKLQKQVRIETFTEANAHHSFVAARAAALDGAEVLAYLNFDGTEVNDLSTLQLLRTRAVENRVFVVGIGVDKGTNKSVIIGPDGAIIATGTNETNETAAIATIDVAEASNKLVAPQTNVFAGRNPGIYRL